MNNLLKFPLFSAVKARIDRDHHCGGGKLSDCMKFKALMEISISALASTKTKTAK